MYTLTKLVKPRWEIKLMLNENCRPGERSENAHSGYILLYICEFDI